MSADITRPFVLSRIDRQTLQELDAYMVLLHSGGREGPTITDHEGRTMLLWTGDGMAEWVGSVAGRYAPIRTLVNTLIERVAALETALVEAHELGEDFVSIIEHLDG